MRAFFAGAVMLVFFACPSSPVAAVDAGTPWIPGVVYRPESAPFGDRGFRDLRGLIHAHSAHSHDACDGKPKLDGGAYDESCIGDFRRDLCRSKHDFVFLSDHGGSFADVEFPDTMLYRAAQGDSLVLHDGAPTANRMTCPDGSRALIMAGLETDMMPVGIERHPADRSIYDHSDAAALNEMKTVGAVALLAHTEGFTPEQLVSLPIDGFEMFNLHRNTFNNGGIAAELILGKVDKGDFDGLPVPDALFMAFNIQDDTYMQIWGTTLARGVRRVTTMGTDCHRNTFPQLMQDGERVDSYRRMMIMFSNHLLVRAKTDGSWDDRDLKEALKNGRLYGTFDFLGVPEGFDYSALVAGATHEMGESVSLASGVTLNISLPHVRDLDPSATAPTITAHLWKAREGGWDDVASTTDATLHFTVKEKGVYRAEIRILPAHMRPFIGKRGDFLKDERPWVYSNPIYVDP